MPEALILPFVIAQAFPAPMITGSLSLLFSKSREGQARGTGSPVITGNLSLLFSKGRAGWAKGGNPIATPADPRHV